MFAQGRHRDKLPSSMASENLKKETTMNKKTKTRNMENETQNKNEKNGKKQRETCKTNVKRHQHAKVYIC